MQCVFYYIQLQLLNNKQTSLIYFFMCIRERLILQFFWHMTVQSLIDG